MKVSHIHLENFKRFRTLDIEVKNRLTSDISDQFLVLGDNGTGKTTVLQAVSLCLSMASGIHSHVTEFDWTGWLPGRYERWGTPVIELNVSFSDDEIDATRELANKWIEWKNPANKIPSGREKQITIRLRGEHISIFHIDGSPRQELLYQLKGRYYASQLMKTIPWIRDFFSPASRCFLVRPVSKPGISSPAIKRKGNRKRKFGGKSLIHRGSGPSP